MLALLTLTAVAQDRKVTGTIVDSGTKEPLEQVTIQLLKPDSSYVIGTLSNEKGNFAVTAPRNGKYLLKMTSVGYKTVVKNINITEGRDLKLGTTAMSEDAVMLKGATVTGQAKKVVVKEDTFVYNSAAFRTPEGSAIEELVKRLPGAQIARRRHGVLKS